jgi:GntR family transcriptional regulator
MFVDRSSPVPYYLQVIDTLRAQIRDGQRTPGEQIPGEFELCQAFNVSRTVIRQALHELTREGLIIRQKGRGTFVAQPKIREGFFQKLTGFYQDMVARGYQPMTRVLKQEVTGATPQVAEMLRIPLRTPVIVIERLRFIEDEPIVYVTTYLPHARCPELLQADLTDQSLYALLEAQFGIFITHGRRSIEAIAAGKDEAALLRVKRGAPLIRLESTSYESDGAPVEYYQALHRGDRSRFEVELVRVRDESEGGLHPEEPERLPPGNPVAPR